MKMMIFELFCPWHIPVYGRHELNTYTSETFIATHPCNFRHIIIIRNILTMTYAHFYNRCLCTMRNVFFNNIIK